MIDAQHGEAIRVPVLQLHVAEPFLELSGIVEGKSVGFKSQCVML